MAPETVPSHRGTKHLADYERAIPGLGKQIVEWTETQRKHRQALEKQRTDGAEHRMDRGQILAGVVALGGLIVAGIVGIFGSAVVGSIIAVVSIGGPTAAVGIVRNWGRTSTPTPPPTPKPPKDSP